MYAKAAMAVRISGIPVNKRMECPSVSEINEDEVGVYASAADDLQGPLVREQQCDTSEAIMVTEALKKKNDLLVKENEWLRNKLAQVVLDDVSDGGIVANNGGVNKEISNDAKDSSGSDQSDGRAASVVDNAMDCNIASGGSFEANSGSAANVANAVNCNPASNSVEKLR